MPLLHEHFTYNTYQCSLLTRDDHKLYFFRRTTAVAIACTRSVTLTRTHVWHFICPFYMNMNIFRTYLSMYLINTRDDHQIVPYIVLIFGYQRHQLSLARCKCVYFTFCALVNDRHRHRLTPPPLSLIPKRPRLQSGIQPGLPVGPRPRLPVGPRPRLQHLPYI